MGFVGSFGVYSISPGETEDGIIPYESGAECFADVAEPDDNERLAFYPDSRLLISRNCEGEKVNETTGKQLITYYVNI